MNNWMSKLFQCRLFCTYIKALTVSWYPLSKHALLPIYSNWLCWFYLHDSNSSLGCAQFVKSLQKWGCCGAQVQHKAVVFLHCPIVYCRFFSHSLELRMKSHLDVSNKRPLWNSRCKSSLLWMLPWQALKGTVSLSVVWSKIIQFLNNLF